MQPLLFWSLALWFSLFSSASAQVVAASGSEGCPTWPSQDVIDQLSRAVVSVTRGDQQGSGLLFAGSRQVVTSLSVVNRPGTPEAVTGSEERTTTIVAERESERRRVESFVKVARPVLEGGWLNGPFYMTVTVELWKHPMGNFGVGVAFDELL